MKILFILDPVERLRLPWDTSSFLAHECQKRGFKVFICQIKDISFQNGKVTARVAHYEVDPHQGYHPLGSPKKIALAQFDFIWMRKDPPVDLNYLYTCHLLSLVFPPTRVLNPPSLLLTQNEKLFPLRFQKAAPPSLVTSSMDALKQFFIAQKKKIVIKPLNERGGRGVKLITNLKEVQFNGRTLLAQKFLPGALSHGDKRVVFASGKLIGAFLRPPSSKTLTGQALPFKKDKPCLLTLKEKAICRQLSSAFKKMGLFFVGIDLIDEYLTEINITSPAGIPELNQLYDKAHEKRVIDLLEEEVSV